MIRKAVDNRITSETNISVELELASTKKSRIKSGVPFFDHMLNSMSRHGRFCMNLNCVGDIDIDDHHSVEDIGICMGNAFNKALGDKSGIKRFGDAILPMDDALTMAAVDLSGRPYFKYNGIELRGVIKEYSEELTLEFLRSFAMHAEINLHVNVLNGENRHHIHESIFKALGVAIYKAATIDESFNNIIPSTKESL